MNKKATNFVDFPEYYLDMMIKLAFDQDDAEAVQQILEDTESKPIPQDEEVVEHAWLHAKAKLAAVKRAELYAKRLKGLKRSILLILEAVACLIIILSITLPIAIASSVEFRSKVMRLLIRIDNIQNEAHFEFSGDANISFSVPNGWNGDYFMSYIPDGMVEVWRSEYVSSIEYSDMDNRSFTFSEFSEASGSSVGTESATISYSDVNGVSACVIDGYSQIESSRIVTVVWSNDAKWFKLDCLNMEVTEALDIARSVRKIIK